MLKLNNTKKLSVFLSFQVTGSGKTLAFVIPIVEQLLKREEKLKKMQVKCFCRCRDEADGNAQF